MCKYDLAKLRSDAADLETQIRILRKEMRVSGHNPTWQECHRKADLRWRLTSLYTFRASLRGKVHSPHMVAEYPRDVRAFVEVNAEVYLLKLLPGLESPGAEPTGLGIASPQDVVGMPVLNDLEVVSSAAKVHSENVPTSSVIGWTLIRWPCLCLSEP